MPRAVCCSGGQPDTIGSMQMGDVVTFALMIAAGGSLWAGEGALVRGDDLSATFWLLVGGTCLWGVARVGRPRAKG